MKVEQACYLLQSIGQWGKKEALAEMEVELMQGYGYILVIADGGNAILQIVKRIAQKISEDSYIGSLKKIYVNEVILATHSFAGQHKGYFKDIHKGILLGKDKIFKLSKQQKTVIDWLSQGYRNSEICTIAGLKLCTVKTRHLPCLQETWRQQSPRCSAKG